MTPPATTEPSERRLKPYGDSGVLVEVADLPAALAFAAAVDADRPPGVLDVVPAARTVLIRLDPARTDVRAVAAAVRPLEPAAVDQADRPLVQIPVQYDGPDLAEVGRLTGLGGDGVVAAHTSGLWTVGFCGFAPGFAYCVGGDPRLHVPRRDEPRTRVPAGSVALAGEFTGVYPRPSPGGWQLIGRTASAVWDLHHDPPALLRPGVRVRFVRATQLDPLPASDAPAPVPVAAPAVEVLATGPLTTVQDLGRPGRAALGVGVSGACDQAALRRANRLAGNVEAAAALEVTFGGLRLRALHRLRVAVTGAPVPVFVDGAPAAMATPLHLPPGSTIELGAALAGARTYVALRGGVKVPPTLGSRSTDLLAGLGPPAVRTGDLLPAGTATHEWAPVDVAPEPVVATGDVTLRVARGPHDDWFTAASVNRLGTTTYTVSADSNRVGVRLTGRPLERSVPGELPSEGVLPGAIQVPPSGQPTVLLADHPVTGGYPVLGVLHRPDVDRAGQLRPGQRVRFRLLAPVTV